MRVSSVASIARVTVSDDDRGVVSVTSGLPSVAEGSDGYIHVGTGW